MNTLIKTIEDLSLNAWPSHQIELYDGWILRFSYFYTHRTNSVEQIGPSTIPVEEKVQYCEEIYRRWGTPAIFKISPLVNPGFDAMLADRGYVVQHTTHVMTMDLANFAKKDPAVAVTVSSFIPPKWIDSLFALKSTTNVMHRMVVPSMYRAIPKETICTSIQDETGTIVATGLGSRPTVNDDATKVTCETFIPGFSGDLYGTDPVVEFHAYLSPSKKFDTLDELRACINNAAKRAQEYFA